MRRLSTPWICIHFFIAALSSSASIAHAVETTATRPNILWLTFEDHGADLPFLGDPHSHTPKLSALAKESCIFTRAFATSPVCAPSRSTIITGVYAATMGSHNMRTEVPLPPGIRPLPSYLRQAGYYCSNNVKTDYNFRTPPGTWDESSRKAHWRNRSDDSQPFFSVFNFTITHEGKYKLPKRKYEELIKDVKPEHRVNPDKMQPPPYFPNTAVTRNDWARHYDTASQMDFEAGQILHQLEEDGLSSNTVIFVFSDHGVGLPRSKRWLYDSGLQVPLIIKWPGVLEPGSHNKELVSLMDLAPTLLSMLGLDVPAYMQGRIIFGPQKQPEPQYLYATRDRVDEVVEMSRSVRDQRFKYIKNSVTDRPYAQASAYADGNPTMREMRRMHKDGTLTGPATMLFQPGKPPEELYDTVADPHEINNLAADPAHRERLETMRAALVKWQKDIDDKGLLPEPEDQKRRAARKRDGKKGEE